MDDEKDKNKVTDLDYLIRLSKGNRQFVKDMVKIFLTENPGEIAALETAIKERDFRLINNCAHKLRSTVPFVGIDKVISEEITEIEKLALDKAGDPFAEKPIEKRNTRFLPTDREMVEKIERLFARIKKICWKAYDELKPYAS
jgi:HPt (histidine-containing phosphotransfer) domain-containing protein